MVWATGMQALLADADPPSRGARWVWLDTVLDRAALAAQASARSRNLASLSTLCRHLIPLVTTAIVLECETVSMRLEQRLATGMSDADVLGFLVALAGVAEAVESGVLWCPRLRDPGDELILEAAANGQEDVLVTHNMRDFYPAAGALGIRIMTPAMLLKELRNE